MKKKKEKEYSEQIINAFLLCNTDTEIAEKCNISRSTVFRYKNSREFKEILKARKTQYITQTVSNMQMKMNACVNELFSIIQDEETPKQTKVNAIQVLFTQCRTWTETTDILERLEALEMAQNRTI